MLTGRAGSCDPRVHGHTRDVVCDLAAAGVETELVIYPREGHVNVERAHALDAIRRTQAWFDRFLSR